MWSPERMSTSGTGAQLDGSSALTLPPPQARGPALTRRADAAPATPAPAVTPAAARTRLAAHARTGRCALRPGVRTCVGPATQRLNADRATQPPGADAQLRA